MSQRAAPAAAAACRPVAAGAACVRGGPHSWGSRRAARTQALLLWAQMALLFTVTVRMFWAAYIDGTARAHLRVFMALRLLSFCSSALQLRTGFPPAASHRCRPPLAVQVAHASWLQRPRSGVHMPNMGCAAGIAALQHARSWRAAYEAWPHAGMHQ